MRESNTELMEDLLEKQILRAQASVEGSKEESNAIKDVCELASKINEAERANLEYWSNSERREIEKQKNESMAEIEKEKLKSERNRKVVDIIKAVTPWGVALFWGGIELYRLHYAGKIEEDGHITSTVGRSIFSPSRIFGKS